MLLHYLWLPDVVIFVVSLYTYLFIYLTTVSRVVLYVLYCEQRNFGWGPQRRETQSWAWWKPGWGWWRSGGWSVCGTKHEIWSRKSERDINQLGNALIIRVIRLKSSVWDSRVGPAEDEESTALWDRWGLLFEVELWQPQWTRTGRDFREVLSVLVKK